MEDKGLISVQRSTPICVAQIYQEGYQSFVEREKTRLPFTK